jgi:hypothetical protein
LAVVVSSWIFDEVVRHTNGNAAAYRPIWVSVKETSTQAWTYLPDHPNPLDNLPVSAPPSPTAKPITNVSGRTLTSSVPTQLPADLSDFTDRRQAQLVDVIPVERTRVLAAAYTTHIENNIGPRELHGRERELAELTAFCAGDEFYAWWQAGPWAGKTALTSWFALHPPVGVSVVAFFITRRLPGQADSGAFGEAVIEQLTVLTGEATIRPDSLATRDGQRHLLLKKAAAQAAAKGRRLLLLVDGLDEDEGIPPAGRSSIARLLPHHAIEGLRVLVTSRPHPGLPHDLAPDHPLREFRKDHPLPRRRPRELKPSEISTHLETLTRLRGLRSMPLSLS